MQTEVICCYKFTVATGTFPLKPQADTSTAPLNETASRQVFALQSCKMGHSNC